MLHDDARGLGKTQHAFPRRIAVRDVVIGQFLALELRIRCDGTRDDRIVAIKGGLLMRIFTITQVLYFHALPVKAIGKSARRCAVIARRQIVADGAVVRCRVREGLLHETKTRRRRQALGVGAELVEQNGIVHRVYDDANVFIVLCGCAHHRRTADVDVLDGVIEGARGIGHGLAKWIEIDDHQIDGRYVVRGQRCHMLDRIATRKNAAVNLRMQCLDATVQHLGKPGVGTDVGDRQSRLLQGLGRAARREQFDTHCAEGGCEFHEAGLVRH